jgi:hypothetical protein
MSQTWRPQPVPRLGEGFFGGTARAASFFAPFDFSYGVGFGKIAGAAFAVEAFRGRRRKRRKN